MAEEVTQITRPSPIIEEAQKNYLDSLKDQVGTALDTSALSLIHISEPTRPY